MLFKRKGLLLAMVCALLVLLCFPQMIGAETLEGTPGTTVQLVTENGDSLKIKSDKTAMTVGDQLTLTLEKPATLPVDAVAAWTSSDATVATVDAGGVVTAVKAGDVTISVKVGDLTDQIVLTVADKAAEPAAITADALRASMTYQAHVQNVGWQDEVHPDGDAGTTGRALRMEALKIKTGQDTAQVGVQYQAHVQNVGWQGWKADGDECGTDGQGLRMEAIQIQLTGAQAGQFDVYYRVHVAGYGWLDWAKNGATAGTTGLAYRMEAIEIQVVAKDAPAPGSTATPYMDGALIRSETHINYQSHVQNIGWQSWVADGNVSGTTGEGKRVEAVVANLTTPYGRDTVSYQAHVQNIGWQGWRASGQEAGTTGQALRVEALQFTLNGATGSVFDIYYRVHVQNLGWMGWAKNGEYAGTSQGGLRVEAYQMVLVPKGGAAPGTTDNAYRLIDNRLGFTPGSPDCICISISQQRMCLYQNYTCTVDTPVVTGMAGIDDTHTGDFNIQGKFTPYRTAGPGFDTVVNYWLTLYTGVINGFYGGSAVGNVGIHDANWRSTFGGTIYQGNGSHGCVNTPDDAMYAIFTNVDVGEPVYIRP